MIRKFIITLLQAQALCSRMHIMQISKKDSAPVDDLIKKLEQYRLKNRIPQQQLAEKIGVNFSTVSRWFNGKTTPNKIQQYHIEKFLKERGIYGKK